MTYSKLRFSKFKKFVFRWVFGELQLTQISLNFKTSCSNLKIRGPGAKLWVAFLLFLFWKELWRFKVTEFIYFYISKKKKKQPSFIHFCHLYLKSSKSFSVSLIRWIIPARLYTNPKTSAAKGYITSQDMDML